jgi:DNA-directed RNA polymerase specialized sigma24 family protein
VFFRDFRASSIDDWFGRIADRVLVGRTGNETSAKPSPARVAALSRSDFDDAVKEALRSYTRPDELEHNPLLRSAIVDTPSADALRARLDEALDALGTHGADQKQRRALMVTYLRGAPTQEVAAERLGIPFGTYRRHLKRGTERLAEWLWQRELRARR